MTKIHLDPNPKRFEKDLLNINVDTLVLQSKNGSLSFDAPYQRGLVWTEFQKEALVSSIVEWIPINAIYWNEYSTSQPYEVIDGKQRLTTIIDYCLDRFKWSGYLYSELPKKHQAIIRGFSVGIYLTRYETVEECEKLYDRINYYGTPHERKESFPNK